METIRKTIVFVPHPDDEINVAGQVIYALKAQRVDVKVCYLTNGDSDFDGTLRINEAVRALAVLGLDADSIFFLGYGDSLIGNKHIYNSCDNDVIPSRSGNIETYGTKEYPEYAYIKFQRHEKYCRNSIKQNIKDVIISEDADLLICVDFDSHPDHRALSLLFEECLGEILKKNIDYEPIVLKKFAYGSVYSGIFDYYQTYPINKTEKPLISRRLDKDYILDNPYYDWDERIRIKAPCECQTRCIRDNIIYKMAREHSSQGIERRVGSICNSDVIYWLRRTDNLLKKAQITVTSGNVTYLSDFKLFDCSDIRIGYDGMEAIDGGFWIPESEDDEKEVIIEFEKVQNVKEIIIYQDVFHDNGIITIEVDTGKQVLVHRDTEPSPRIKLLFEDCIYTQKVIIRITEYIGDRIGIGEIEVFSDKELRSIFEFELEDRNFYPKRKLSVIDIIDKWIVKPLEIGENEADSYEELDRLFVPEKLRGIIDSVGWKRVIIYGYGKIGYRLSKEIKEYVIAYVDRRGKLLKCDTPVYIDVSEVRLDKVDGIIITIKNDRTIKETLINSGWETNQIIDVSDLIDMLKKVDKDV